MKRFAFPLTVLGIGLVLVAALALTGQFSQDSASDGIPRIVFDPNPEGNQDMPKDFIKKDIPYEVQHYFGVLPQNSEKTKVFTFKNTGTGTLVIKEDPRTGCDCIKASVSPRKIPPGRTGELKITFNSRTYKTTQGRAVTLVTNDPEKPETNVLVVATVKVEFKVEPGLVQFGDASQGERIEKEITIRNLAGNPFNILGVQYGNGSLRHEAAPLGEGVPADAYRIRFWLDEGAPAQTIAEEIHVFTDNKNQNDIKVIVMGNIYDGLRFQPPVISFGPVQPGETRTKTVKATNFAREPIAITAVESKLDFVSVKVVVEKPGKEYSIHATLEKTPDPGKIFEGIVVVRTDRSTRPETVLTVTGVVAAPKEPAVAPSGSAANPSSPP